MASQRDADTVEAVVRALHIYRYVCIDRYRYRKIDIYVCVCVSIYIYIYIYIYI